MITPLNPTPLIRLDLALRAAGIPIDGVAGVQGSVRVDYQPAATAQNRTDGAAIVAAFDWSAAADATFIAQQAKTLATAQIDNGALQSGVSLERLVRALALVMLDEVNLIRANFAVPMTTRTATQLVNAIKAKIAATPE